MELHEDGDLLALMNRTNVTGFDEDSSREISRQILSGLHLLYRCRVVHLDISLENILCTGYGTADFRAVFTDFGRSELLPLAAGPFALGEVQKYAEVGKSFYLAPEYFISNKQNLINALLTDIWEVVIYNCDFFFFES